MSFYLQRLTRTDSYARRQNRIFDLAGKLKKIKSGIIEKTNMGWSLVFLIGLISISATTKPVSAGRMNRDTQVKSSSQFRMKLEYSYTTTTAQTKKTCSGLKRRHLDLVTARQHGERVAKESVSAVERILGSTRGMLFKIAWVESRFGEHPLTYRSGYYGGIFQVGRRGFQSTQDVRSHRRLAGKLARIKRALCIDWSRVEWRDLTKPLYSAIAARLFLLNKPGAIPRSLSGQAKYWKDQYLGKHGKGTAEQFKKRWRTYLKM